MKKLDVYNKNYEFYKKYHNNLGNILVHIICIPYIVWSVFGLSNQLGYFLGLNKNSNIKYLPSISIYSSYMYYYYKIAPKKVFEQTFYFYLILLMKLNYYYDYKSLKYLVIQILSWIAQIASHKYIEGNSPALLKGLKQSFLTAPIFVVDEIKQQNMFNFKKIFLIYSFYKLFRIFIF